MQHYSGLPCRLTPRLGESGELSFLMSLILHWESLPQSLRCLSWPLRSDTVE